MVSYLHRITRNKENEPQNDLIREFSLQMIHEPITITANGFFNIDFELLGSVSDGMKLMSLFLLIETFFY